MRWLTNLPIRGKLMSVTVLAIAIALLLTGSTLIVYDNLSYRAQKKQEISVQAQILAASVTASLEFNDRKAGQEYLNALEANSEIAAAGGDAADGSLFVSYSRPGGSARPIPTRAEPQGQRFEGSELVAFWP